MKFYLGTHMPSWLGYTDVPLFVSRTRLERSAGELRKTLPKARGRWAMDSGGFTQLHKFGRWVLTPEQYVAEVRRARDEIGGLDWAAPMDWMCEPSAKAATGLTTRDHQTRTVDNFLHLRALAPDLPFVPVLQGFELSDYLTCLDLYERAGVDLSREMIVGLGSVCRRQATAEIDLITSVLHRRGLRLHGFGVKTSGLAAYAPCLTSADSLAWSYRGRRVRPCEHGKAMHEGNCLPFALTWRRRVLEVIGAHVQLALPLEVTTMTNRPDRDLEAIRRRHPDIPQDPLPIDVPPPPPVSRDESKPRPAKSIRFASCPKCLADREIGVIRLPDGREVFRAHNKILGRGVRVQCPGAYTDAPEVRTA